MKPLLREENLRGALKQVIFLYRAFSTQNAAAPMIMDYA
jgi:hypothetical protein